jgi:glutamine cyclotransferase
MALPSGASTLSADPPALSAGSRATAHASANDGATADDVATDPSASARLPRAGAPVVKALAARELAKPPKYTQGLFFLGDLLYESSGLYGRSQLNVWKAAGDSLVLAAGVCLPENVFAEGAALALGAVTVLTWRENLAMRFTPELEHTDRAFFAGQGWGLAWDGERLWRSDGSNRLQAHDPLNFGAAGPPLAVTDAGIPVSLLNELEYDPGTGLLLANVYQTDRVAAIDPATGDVSFWLDFAAIAAPVRSRLKTSDTVLNGLAIDSEGRLYATGKMWDRIFQVEYSLPQGIGSRDPPPSEASDPPVFPERLKAGCPVGPVP